MERTAVVPPFARSPATNTRSRLVSKESAERVVLHCFSGDATLARECTVRGYFVSFAGSITYPGNQYLRDAAAAVPIDSLLAETDTPFLSPQPLRGRDNSPANVVAVVDALADARGTSFERVAEATSRNAKAAFPGLR